MKKISITPLQWVGPRTPYSSRFEDVYFSGEDGIAESEYVYLDGVQFDEITQNKSESENSTISIAEIGFGVGLNFLLTVRRFLKIKKPHQRMTYMSVEGFPVSQEDLIAVYEAYPELQPYAQPLIDHYPLLTPGYHSIYFKDWSVHLILALGDALEMISEYTGPVDAWYFDGFNPKQNESAFQNALFLNAQKISQPHARFASFTSAGWVRRGLSEHGATVVKRKGFGKKRECIQGSLLGSYRPLFPYQLSDSNSVPKKVNILGTGVAGASLFHQLSIRGIETVLFDQASALGTGASGNRLGLFNIQFSKKPNPISLFALKSLDHFLRLQKELNLEIAPGLLRQGTEEDISEMRESLRVHEVPSSFFEDRRSDGIFFPKCGALAPTELLKKLLKDADIRWNTSEAEFFDATSDTPNDARIYAMGHGIHSSLFHRNFFIPTRPVRGEVLHLKPLHDHSYTTVKQHYLGPNISSLQGFDGHLYGATYSTQNLSWDPCPKDQHELLETLRTEGYFPEVISSRVGFRVSTPDKLPIIGPVGHNQQFESELRSYFRGQSPKNLTEFQMKLPHPLSFVLTGLGSRGLTTAGVCAEIITCQILKDPIPIEKSLMDHLHSSRFILRALRRNQPLQVNSPYASSE